MAFITCIIALRTHGCLTPVDVGFGHGAPPSCRVSLDHCVSAGDRARLHSVVQPC
jgi:hypothetical protein